MVRACAPALLAFAVALPVPTAGWGQISAWRLSRETAAAVAGGDSRVVPPRAHRRPTWLALLGSLAALLGCDASTPPSGSVGPTPTVSATQAPEVTDAAPLPMSTVELTPTLTVSVPAPGYSVEEMEMLVTRPLEEACSRLPGARSQSSISAEGVTVIHVELESAADPYAARAALLPLLEQAATTLPEAVERPIVTAHPTDRPTRLRYWLESDQHTLEALREIHDDAIRDKLSELDGVWRSPVCGGGLPEVVIELDRARMLAMGIGLEPVQSAIGQAQLPKLGEPLLRIGGSAVELDELTELPIARSTGGRALRLGDLATIRRQAKPDRCRAFSHTSREGVMGIIHVHPRFSAAQTRDRVWAELRSIASNLPPDLKIRPVAMPELDRQAARFDLTLTGPRDQPPKVLLAWLGAQDRSPMGPSEWYLEVGSAIEPALHTPNREATLTVVAPAGTPAPSDTMPDLVARFERSLSALQGVHLRGTRATAGATNDRPLVELRLFYESDRHEAGRVASDAAQLAKRIPGVLSAWLPDDNLEPEISYRVDPKRLARAGIRTGQIPRAIRAALAQLDVGRVRIGPRRTVPLRIQVIPSLGKDASALGNVRLMTSAGREVRLGDIARIELSQGQSAIRRQDQRSYIPIELALASGQADAATEQLRHDLARDLQLPAGVALELVAPPASR